MPYHDYDALLYEESDLKQRISKKLGIPLNKS